MSHDELNALCAEKVAGFTEIVQLGANPLNLAGTGRDGHRSYIPCYCTDPAAVIALMEKDHYDVDIHFSQTCDIWSVSLLQRFTGKDSFSGKAESFAEAGVRALLKAHGCEVGE